MCHEHGLNHVLIGEEPKPIIVTEGFECPDFTDNHLQNKNYTKSIELFNRILTHFPENLSVLRNLLHAYAFSGDFHNAENTIKKVLRLNEKEPYVYQFYASILKNQDKIDEMINLIEEGLSKNLMNPKWKYQKELLFPVVVKDNDEIDKFRLKIKNCYDQILQNSDQLDYDNDQIIQTPHYECSYNQHDNLELNIKSVKALRKIYKELNENCVVKKKENEKIKIGFISEFFTNHTIGKLFGNLIKDIDPTLYNQYVMERYKEGNVRQSHANVTSIMNFSPEFANRTVLDDLLAPVKNTPAETYLRNRMIPESCWKDLYYVDNIEKIEQLSEKYKDRIIGNESRLVIPFMDRSGKLVGVTCRALGDERLRYVTVRVNEEYPMIYNIDKVDITEK